MVTPPAGGGSATTVNDYYQLGQLAYQTNGVGTLLASYTYDSSGAPVSVQVGSDVTTAPRYYYVYDARSDVVNLVDGSGAVVATYAYDAWGNLTTSSESIPNANGWVNPFRFDGRDGVRYDSADGLYWLSVRAYDPTLGRFLSRDPLGRAPLFLPTGNDNPYVYAGNNPLSNVDPSGQYRATGHGASVHAEDWSATKRHFARIVQHSGCDAACQAKIHTEWVSYRLGLAKKAQGIAGQAAAYFWGQSRTGLTLNLGGSTIAPLKGTPTIGRFLTVIETAIGSFITQLADNPFLTIGFGGWVTGVFTYDLVSLLPWAYFQQEADAGSSWWLDPNGVAGDWSAMGIILSLIAALIIPICGVLAALSPEDGVILAGIAIGAEVAVIRLLPRVKAYIDQEEDVLGYTLS